MKTIYSMGKGKYITLDSYGKTHQSNHLLKAVVAALILAASISTITALVSKYTTLDPQVIKAPSRTSWATNLSYPGLSSMRI
jgi:energy-converting hydrogenase Eha subunit A